MQFSQGVKIMNTGFHVFMTDDTEVGISAMLGLVEFWWEDSIRDYQSNQCRLDSVRWNEPWREINESVMVSGALSGDVVPPNIAVLVKNVTVGGPPGRQFWPGLLENQVDANGLLLAGHLANWVTQSNRFITELDAAGAGATVPFNPVVRRSDGSNADWASCTVRAMVGVQNRRLRPQ